MNKSVKLRTAIAIFIVMAVICVDQIIKIYIKTHLCLYEKVKITDWFYIFFTENQGMAFGIDVIGTWILTLFRLVTVGFFSYLLVKVVRRRFPIGFVICLSMIIAGAFGNIIDNCFYGMCFSESVPIDYLLAQPAEIVAWGTGYGHFMNGLVVDMFYFPLFRWPEWTPIVGGNIFFGAVFNFADASISCGAVAMLLFYHSLLGGKFAPSEKNVPQP